MAAKRKRKGKTAKCTTKARRRTSKKGTARKVKTWRLGKGNFCRRAPGAKKPKCGFSSAAAAKKG